MIRADLTTAGPRTSAPSPSFPQQLSNTGIDALPWELVQGIFLNLGISDLPAATLVCKHWSELLGERNRMTRNFIQGIYEKSLPIPVGNVNHIAIDRDRLLFSANKQIRAYDLQKATCTTLVERKQERIGSNYADFFSISDDGLFFFRDAPDNNAIYAIYRKDLITNEECILTGSQNVTSFVLDNDRLFSAGSHEEFHNYDIQERNLKRSECKTLLSVPAYVRSLTASENKVCFYTRYAITILDLKTGHKKMLYGHQKPVKCLVINRGKLFSGSDDMTLKMWDLETGRCEGTFSGHTGAISSIATDKDNFLLVSGCTNGELKVWDVKTRTCRRTLIKETDEGGWITDLLVTNNKLYACVGCLLREGGGVYLWDFKAPNAEGEGKG